MQGGEATPAEEAGLVELTRGNASSGERTKSLRPIHTMGSEARSSVPKPESVPSAQVSATRHAVLHDRA
jgi:hypothetical protein